MKTNFPYDSSHWVEMYLHFFWKIVVKAIHSSLIQMEVLISAS